MRKVIRYTSRHRARSIQPEAGRTFPSPRPNESYIGSVQPDITLRIEGSWRLFGVQNYTEWFHIRVVTRKNALFISDIIGV